jgi:hypothetical protein
MYICAERNTTRLLMRIHLHLYWTIAMPSCSMIMYAMYEQSTMHFSYSWRPSHVELKCIPLLVCCLLSAILRSKCRSVRQCKLYRVLQSSLDVSAHAHDSAVANMHSPAVSRLTNVMSKSNLQQQYTAAATSIPTLNEPYISHTECALLHSHVLVPNI